MRPQVLGSSDEQIWIVLKVPYTPVAVGTQESADPIGVVIVVDMEAASSVRSSTADCTDASLSLEQMQQVFLRKSELAPNLTEIVLVRPQFGIARALLLAIFANLRFVQIAIVRIALSTRLAAAVLAASTETFARVRFVVEPS